MPFDFHTPEADPVLRITFASERYNDGVSWRDTPVSAIFDSFNMISRFEDGEIIDIRPAPEPTREFRFTDEYGLTYGIDELPGVLPEIAKRNRRDQKLDKHYGMTAETRRNHRSADKHTLEENAKAYAESMTGRCAANGAVHTQRIRVPGKTHPEIRAKYVQLSDGEIYDIPHWDFIDPGIEVIAA